MSNGLQEWPTLAAVGDGGPTEQFGSSIAAVQVTRQIGHLLDRLFDKPECVGVLDQRPHLGALKTTRHFRFDLELELHLTVRQRRELLDDRLDNLMNVPPVLDRKSVV